MDTTGTLRHHGHVPRRRMRRDKEGIGRLSPHGPDRIAARDAGGPPVAHLAGHRHNFHWRPGAARNWGRHHARGARRSNQPPAPHLPGQQAATRGGAARRVHPTHTPGSRPTRSAFHSAWHCRPGATSTGRAAPSHAPRGAAAPCARSGAGGRASHCRDSCPGGRTDQRAAVVPRGPRLARAGTRRRSAQQRARYVD
jgi:hypothetical protein